MNFGLVFLLKIIYLFFIFEWAVFGHDPINGANCALACNVEVHGPIRYKPMHRNSER